MATRGASSFIGLGTCSRFRCERSTVSLPSTGGAIGSSGRVVLSLRTASTPLSRGDFVLLLLLSGRGRPSSASLDGAYVVGLAVRRPPCFVPSAKTFMRSGKLKQLPRWPFLNGLFLLRNYLYFKGLLREGVRRDVCSNVGALVS